MTNISSAGRRNPKELRPHPLNEEIYGDRADSELVASVKEKGIYNPLLITHDNRIVSGHRRWGAALAAGVDSVPVVVFVSQDELDIKEALIESNRQREKDNEQIGREYIHLKRIFNERSSRQGANQYTERASDKSLSEARKPTVQAAASLGISQPTANKAEKVVIAIDELKAQGETATAESLRQKLNTSVNGAYNQAKQNGHIAPPTPKKAPPTIEHITLAQWEQMNESERWQAVTMPGNKTFNSTNDNVEWAQWTWNPVTGCLHGCDYCYARDIATRFYSHLGNEDDRFQPAFYPDRISAPANTRQPDFSTIDNPVERLGKRNVFVCSMADLFGKWVPSEWIELVLEQVRNNPQWNFLFLTKFPIRMSEFDYPPNAWLGTTVDKQWSVSRAEKAFLRLREKGYKGIAWLSCEPMLERLTFERLDMFDWLVVGGGSKSTQTPETRPNFEWIAHIWQQAKRFELPVYMKTNLGIEQRVREFPPLDNPQRKA